MRDVKKEHQFISSKQWHAKKNILQFADLNYETKGRIKI